MEVLATTWAPHPGTGHPMELRVVEWTPGQLGLVAREESGAEVFVMTDDDIGEVDADAPPLELREDAGPLLAHAATEAWLEGLRAFVLGRRHRGRQPPGHFPGL